MIQTRYKILLIQPPHYRLFKETYSLSRYPLSLGYLASAIKKETNWDVMVYNADFFPSSEPIEVGYLASGGFTNYLRNLNDQSAKVWDGVKNIILEYRPTVIGISTYTQNFISACAIAKFAKKIDPQIKIIVGGPHPSMVGKDILQCPNIDIAVKGEGEITLIELLEAIRSNSFFDDIRGIIYKKNGDIIENPNREFIEDLDATPSPYEYVKEVLKDYNQYPITAFRSIFAIRGCPYSCFFCGSHKIWSRKVRFRSVANVIKEIKIMRDMGLKSISFEDDTFGITKEYIRQLCNALIKDCPGLKWSCELHVKLIDEQIIRLMKKAGCYFISVGVESGNNEMLRKIRKNITIEEALAACKIIKKNGIYVNAFFMIGYPWETEKTLEDTVSAMQKIDCDYLLYSIFTPYPGTESFEICKKNGLIADGYDVSLYNHQSPANCFCSDIAPERFRKLAFQIESMVDKKNRRTRIKQIFSPNIIWRIQELGINKSIQRAIPLFFNRK